MQYQELRRTVTECTWGTRWSEHRSDAVMRGYRKFEYALEFLNRLNRIGVDAVPGAEAHRDGVYEVLDGASTETTP